ncbi:MAG: efflux RND transporter permease subunit [Bacteroidales bacterium]
MTRSSSYGFSAFTLNVVLVILVIAGLSVIPFLSVKLNPSTTLPSVTVACTWPGASSRIIEAEVTSRMEGMVSTMKGVRRVTSRSEKGRGTVTVEFDRSADMDFARFEISGKIRRAFSGFPEGVSYPVISMNRPDEEAEIQVLAYTLNAGASPQHIGLYAEEHFRVPLSLIEGVHEVRIYGYTPFAWIVRYDPRRLHSLGLQPSGLRQAMAGTVEKHDVGFARDMPGRQEFLVLTSGQSDSIQWENIPVAEKAGRIIRLGDVADVRYASVPPSSYFRVNGLNTVNLVIYAEKQANQLALASRVKKRMEELSGRLPPGYSLVNLYDSTLFLKQELKKIAYRTLFSVLFLLSFVLLVTRRFRYMLIIAISLFANLAVACFFYYVSGLEIHLYTLAGITVSLGIIIDNTLVMADHIRYHRNRKAFIAVLAATLTTVAALTAIFFLEENIRLNLVDFARVVIINLMVSLTVALVFLPALMEKIPVCVAKNRRRIRHLRRSVGWNRRYRRFLQFALKTRWVWIVLAVLAFGLPVNQIPDRLEGDSRVATWYNRTLGSTFFVQDVKPLLYKLAGGSLRLFSQYVFDRYYYQTPERTTLYVRVYMPEGATLGQMNEIFIDLENFLSRYPGVEQYQSHISSARRGTMIIYFRKEYENGPFPYRLKSELEQYAVYSGGADFSIFGVGQAFSNVYYTGFTNSSVVLTGYNYDELLEYARSIAQMILEQPRVREVLLRAGDGRYQGNVEDLRYLDIDPSHLPGGPASLLPVFATLAEYGTGREPFLHIPGEVSWEPVVLEPDGAENFSTWDLFHQPLESEPGKMVRLAGFGTLRVEKGEDQIMKEDQQYQLTLAYDYIGPDKMARIAEDSAVVRANRMLPMGYRASHRDWYYGFGQDGKPYRLIPLILLMVYIICAVLLESFTLPLAVIATVPFSFIGVFLTFYLFGLSFDQGGFASFLLLSGLTVNASLYILNQKAVLERKGLRLPGIDLYLKAFQAKVIPVFLTTLSTVVGLIPFLMGGQSQVFWFALAAGSIGGLVFSVPAVLLLLPLLMGNMKNVAKPATGK